MAIDFVTSPSQGQTVIIGKMKYVYEGTVWNAYPLGGATTARPKNYLINPCFSAVQQQSGASVSSGTISAYPADQWLFTGQGTSWTHNATISVGVDGSVALKWYGYFSP